MDWKSRATNIPFWVNIALAVFVPVGAYFGLSATDITNWDIVIDTAIKAISNPYVCGTILVGIWNAVHNPTTKGITD